jgi:hypothetical protein
MNTTTFRRMALALEDAVEGAHMDHPDFRVKNRVFASLHSKDRFGMVKLTPAQQKEFVEGHPGAFEPESGAWGRSGYTRVILNAADEEAVGEALTLAWQNTRTAPTRKRRRRPVR